MEIKPEQNYTKEQAIEFLGISRLKFRELYFQFYNARTFPPIREPGKVYLQESRDNEISYPGHELIRLKAELENKRKE